MSDSSEQQEQNPKLEDKQSERDSSTSSSSSSDLSDQIANPATQHSNTFHRSRFVKLPENNGCISVSGGINSTNGLNATFNNQNNLGGNNSTLNMPKVECSLQAFEIQPEIKGMIVILSSIGVTSNKVVDEIAKLGFRVTENNVLTIWDDWNQNRIKIGKKRTKTEPVIETRTKEKVTQPRPQTQMNFESQNTSSQSKFEQIYSQDRLNEELFRDIDDFRENYHMQGDNINNGSMLNNNHMNSTNNTTINKPYIKREQDEILEEQESAFDSDNYDQKHKFEDLFEMNHQVNNTNQAPAFKEEQKYNYNNDYINSDIKNFPEFNISNNLQPFTSNIEAIEAEEDHYSKPNTHCLFYHEDKQPCEGCLKYGKGTNQVQSSCLQCDFDAGKSIRYCQQCFDMRHGISQKGYKKFDLGEDMNRKKKIVDSDFSYDSESSEPPFKNLTKADLNQQMEQKVTYVKEERTPSQLPPVIKDQRTESAISKGKKIIRINRAPSSNAGPN